VSLATFAANIPVIVVTLRSPRFEDDSVAKIMASLAVSDIINGIVSACRAGVAWSLQPGEQVPMWLLRVLSSGMYTFGVCSAWKRGSLSLLPFQSYGPCSVNGCPSWLLDKKLKSFPSHKDPLGGADLRFNSPQPDISRSCKSTDTGLVCRVGCLVA